MMRISHRILTNFLTSKHFILPSKSTQCLYNIARKFTEKRASQCSIFNLESRSLVEIQGRDTTSFLQGLLTNDVDQLNEKNVSQYSMMLNVQGRVLYDLILYLIPNKSDATTIWIECDSKVKDELLQTMKKYKIRKKISISDISQTVLVHSSQNYQNLNEENDKIKLISPDPRIPELGHRILATKDFYTGDDTVIVEKEDKYVEYRYKLGIGEGCVDLPPGNAFPLESNLIFLKGVSFDKGCYIGQELTARTFYTGVTRKRLMPLVFHSDNVDVAPGTTIKSEKEKSVGKFRHAVNQVGLGLMRVAEVKGDLNITDKNNQEIVCTAVKPSWWPQENHDR